MLSDKIAELEHENIILKDALEELGKQIEQNGVRKPRSCQYCKNFIQHYMKYRYDGNVVYSPINAGHCISRVPIKNGGKKNPSPEDTCPFFEVGIYEMRHV
ncbi:MAG: hypothetical protein NC118_12080 [Eubacterium sp.]|nr:hypothetical protein [Eubacterium sp.]